MTITITTAPCCWGVDDITNLNLPDWRQVLDEAAAAGYGGLELGPCGYMPLDAGTVSAELRRRDLYVVAGTIFDNLVDPANRKGLEHQTRQICAVIAALPKPPLAPGQRFPAPYLTVMDWGHEARDYAAGHSDRAARLDDAAWRGMVANIRAIARIARDHGVRAVIHPHAGGHIEFADEIARITRDISAAEAGLCLDTGHTFYAGMDPVAVLEAYWDRLDYIHFKDIDAARYSAVMARRIRFFDACAEGVMCPIGDGCIDYPAIKALLNRRGYAGFITVEQERDPLNAGGSLADLRKSRRYLETVGFARPALEATR
ncbi:TIM barrel protein [Paracoccus benzoatiresistens]|uniref:TIM barrel protein n=1 Tax=Paracoccus benzoatiresistens TaxID=2997341 RepID=A0ABT4J1R8_9RHOB|nr:TIM barrel protein [Paracoccus sp. EF6]MCZ0961022.1 TIM barrel protein [Paracoccus sp. EF6]